MSVEKPEENFASLFREYARRHPTVFLPNLFFVFGKAFARLSENAQVNIYEQCFIRRTRDVMLRRKHEISCSSSHILRRVDASEKILLQIGALFLVVAGARIVNSVMKTDRKFNKRRLLSPGSRSIEFTQAFRDVLLIVIIPMRLSIGTRQSIVPRTCSGSAEGAR
jgi:hypothetical protein